MTGPGPHEPEREPPAGPLPPPWIPPPRSAAEDEHRWPGADGGAPDGEGGPAGWPAPDAAPPPEHRGGDREGGPPGDGPDPEPTLPGDRSEPRRGAPAPEAAESGIPQPRQRPASPDPLPHNTLKSLLGAWALAACSAEESAAVEAHLTDCAGCADEALRLRDAVGLLHHDGDLDLDPLLRSRVLADCLGRRPARIPVPEWALPYDGETARLDALLRDIDEADWRAPVRLRWFEDGGVAERHTTVAGVIEHLYAVDGLVAAALGLPDPLATPRGPGSASERTEALWRAGQPTADDAPARPEATEASLVGADRATGLGKGPPEAVRRAWREQGRTLIRTISFASRGVSELTVRYPSAYTYRGGRLSLRDAFLERAFECWVHAGDIADAVDYPYAPPVSAHLHLMIDLAARLLPEALAERRRTGRAAPARGLVAAGAPGRTLHLEVEGNGGGHWYIPLDSPAAAGSPTEVVAHIALDRDAFYQLAAGHVAPEEAAVGQLGDSEAIRDVLFATASLSRL